MPKKTWAEVAKERKQYPGVPLLVTKPEPKTSLNLPLLTKLMSLAQREGLTAEIKPLREGRRPLGLWVYWPES